jgi:RNA polymerase sigma-70 factor (ECF subfamily)
VVNRINTLFHTNSYIITHHSKQMSENEMTGNILYFARREAKATAAAPAPETVRAEARIVERVRAGEREAFGELYKMFAPMIHGIVLARVPRDEVDDIVQNVFLSAYKNLHTLREPNAVGAWLAMIARNRANEFYRQVRPTEELSEDLSHHDSPRAEAREILAAIQALPEAYKETLVLRLVEGMTGPEIAEQTGLTPDSVRVNLHRGMKLLRTKLGIQE